MRALLNAFPGGLPRGVAQGAVCPPFPYLAEGAERLRGTPLALGAQNVSEHAPGAYTGEVSAAMLADVGSRHAIDDHSDRRQIFAESMAEVAGKCAAAP